MALAKPSRELLLKIAFPCSRPLEGIPRRSRANDNVLRFSGHLGFLKAKSAFKDCFLHHSVPIMSILCIQGINEIDRFIKCVCSAIFSLAISVCSAVTPECEDA